MSGLPETFALLDEANMKADSFRAGADEIDRWLILTGNAVSEALNRLMLCRGENFTSITLDQAITSMSDADIRLVRMQRELQELRFSVEASQRFMETYRHLLGR
jgi:hypothetical protein